MTVVIFGYRVILDTLYQAVFESMKAAMERATHANERRIKAELELSHAMDRVKKVEELLWFHSGEGYTPARKGDPELDGRAIRRWDESKQGGDSDMFRLQASLWLTDTPENHDEIFEVGRVNWRGLNWKLVGMSSQMDTFTSDSFYSSRDEIPRAMMGMRTIELSLEAYADTDNSRYQQKVTK